MWLPFSSLTGHGYYVFSVLNPYFCVILWQGEFLNGLRNAFSKHLGLVPNKGPLLVL